MTWQLYSACVCTETAESRIWSPEARNCQLGVFLMSAVLTELSVLLKKWWWKFDFIVTTSNVLSSANVVRLITALQIEESVWGTNRNKKLKLHPGCECTEEGQLLCSSASPIPAGWQAHCTPQPGPSPAELPSPGASHVHLRWIVHTDFSLFTKQPCGLRITSYTHQLIKKFHKNNRNRNLTPAISHIYKIKIIKI